MNIRTMAERVCTFERGSVLPPFRGRRIPILSLEAQIAVFLRPEGGEIAFLEGDPPLLEHTEPAFALAKEEPPPLLRRGNA